MNIPEKLTKLEKLYIDMTKENRKNTLTSIKTRFPHLNIATCLSVFNKDSRDFKLVL